MLQKTVVIAFSVLGLLWYYICLIVIGFQTSTYEEGASFRDFMSMSVTTIGVTLATFVGMLLGVQRVVEDIREKSPPTTNPEIDKIANSEAASYVQWAAVALYALSLVLALFCWWYKGDGVTDACIKNLAKSTLGVIGGALSVFLARR